MGCDAYASKDGKLKIVVKSYHDGRLIGVIEVEGLDEREKLAVDYEEGEER